MAEENALEELRRRLDEIQSRHEVDGAAAARAYWRSLRSSSQVAPGGESDDRSVRSVRPGSHGPSAAAEARADGRPSVTDPAADADAAAGCRTRRGPRKGGAWTRASQPSAGRGFWAQARPDGEIALGPREMNWADDLDDADEEARWRAVTESPETTEDEHAFEDGPEPARGRSEDVADGATVDAPEKAADDVAGEVVEDAAGKASVDAAEKAADDAAREAADHAPPEASGDDVEAVASPEPPWGDLATGATGATVLVGLHVDAITGRPLDRHGEGAVLVAAEQAASLRGQHDVMLVNLVAELEARGVDSPGGLSRVDWLRALDPGMTAAQAKAFVTVARAITDPVWSQLAARVTMQHVTVGKAALIIEFHQRTAPVADPEDLGTALDDLIAQAPKVTPEDLARLARHHGEQIRPPREQERLDAGRQEARGLWFGQPSATGMVSLRGTLDPEAAAIIKSAVDPLSVPCPVRDEHGRTIASDPRTPARRRAEALLEIVQRGVASAERVPTTDKAKIVVTIDHDVLAGRVEGTGLAMTGDVLSASTVRRLACDAAIVPMVLGGSSEPLELGRERRLVTKGLRIALWQRDGGCSFPGCTIPASWCDAHHVVPWYLGGQTNLRGMALLCRRHHTHVHRRELTATVTPTSVTWHE